jgi:hypothetical protein
MRGHAGRRVDHGGEGTVARLDVLDQLTLLAEVGEDGSTCRPCGR